MIQIKKDYSIYDARRAEFETVVFVTKLEIEEDFKSQVGNQIEKCMEVKYIHQLKEDLPEDIIVSMNMWGFNRSFLDEAWSRFPAFLDKVLSENPTKAEYFLLTVVNWLINEGAARVKVLRSADKWYGVTYREDKITVMAEIAAMTAFGPYPVRLWEEML